MNDTTQTAASALYDASNELDRIRGEIGTVAILVGHFDSDISEGMCSFLTGWANGLDTLADALDQVRKERAAQMAEPAEPELTPAEKLDRRRWQAKKFRQMADELEREGVAEFAAGIADQGARADVEGTN